MRDLKKIVDFTLAERRLLDKLSSPVKIQNYLDTLKINFEPKGDTLLSPRVVFRDKLAHCIEGALVAAVACWYHGQPPLLLDLVGSNKDFDHVVALFKKNGRWGAISKTNHAVLRYREPVYNSVRELAMSYFHEYFIDDGRKTLRTYSDPFDVSKMKNTDWITAEDNQWHIAERLNNSPHHSILTRSMIAGLRRADGMEIKAGKLLEWKPRT